MFGCGPALLYSRMGESYKEFSAQLLMYLRTKALKFSTVSFVSTSPRDLFPWVIHRLVAFARARFVNCRRR